MQPSMTSKNKEPTFKYERDDEIYLNRILDKAIAQFLIDSKCENDEDLRILGPLFDPNADIAQLNFKSSELVKIIYVDKF